MGGRKWTKSEQAQLCEMFPRCSTKEIAEILGRTLSAVFGQAYLLGLRKSEEYLESPAACRLRREDHPGREFQFKKGHVPANKGLRRPGWFAGRMKETQFKPGVRQGIAEKNWRPIGTILPDSDGYLRIKVREARPGEAYGWGNPHAWPQLHRHLWEQANGPLPKGHFVVFKDGNKKNCTLDNLECISRAENMRRNSIHKLPRELKSTIILIGAIKRRIRNKERNLANGKEHDSGPSQPSLRNDRSVEG